MISERGQQRALIYSHDSFGLGHLRRCRAIAHALVDQNPDMSVIILSGSPIIGNFVNFRPFPSKFGESRQTSGKIR